MSQEVNTTGVFHQSVVLSLDDVGLQGELNIPQKAKSIVMFVDGVSSRLSEFTRSLARELNRFGFATLTLDLTTTEEDTDEQVQTRQILGFNSELIAHRVMEASKWLRSYGDTEQLPIGIFATEQGSEAALIAASHLQNKVRAIVIANGWISLADSVIKKVKCPTLFITRTDKLEESLQMRSVASRLTCEHHVESLSLSNGDDRFDCFEADVAVRTKEWLSCTLIATSLMVPRRIKELRWQEL